MIKFQNLTKSFGDHVVLKSVSGEIDHGKSVVLLGPSGSGKSTLLRCMNLLETPDSGQIELDGHPITGSKSAFAKVRHNIGMVFQHFHLFPHMTVLENITFAPRKVLGMKRKDAENQALDLLSRVGLVDKSDAYPSRLSGGQKQRIAIARSLAMNPKIMLFDEPTSALDPEMVHEVLDVIKSLNQDMSRDMNQNVAGQGNGQSMTMMIVTHEMNFAQDIADEIWFLDQGEIVEKTDAKKFFKAPTSKRAQAFLSKVR